MNMNMKNVLTTFIALCLAAAVALLAYFLQKSHKAATLVKQEDLNSVPVLMAKINLKPGDQLDMKNFAWGKWPKDSVDPNYFTKENESELAKIKGGIVRFAISKGAPLSRNDIMVLGDKSMVTAFVDPGMRAVTIPLSHVDNPSVHFAPGDYVDLLLPSNTNQNKLEVNIFIKGVRVIAVDEHFKDEQPGVGKAAGSTVPKTITVEVDPQQAKLLAESILGGHIVVSQYSAFSPPSSKVATTEEEKKTTPVTVLRGTGEAKAPVVVGLPNKQ
jgi:pilus assembly protein CpaB